MRSQSLVTLNDPMSYASECYKMFRTNLRYTNVDKSNQVILVTSSSPGEGKTTSVANIAVSFAQEGKKVLIIESDLRLASIHQMFKLEQSPGLTDILAGTRKLENTVHKMVEVDKLDIITSGVLPPSPSELLGAKAFSNLIETARTQYDIILLDAPPVLLVSDAAILSRFADGVILVVALRESKKDLVINTVKALEKVGANLLGVLLTKEKISGNEYKYSYSNKKHKRKK